jgi:hypothetical protein
MANPPDREPARPLPTLGGVEPGNDNAPSAGRIACRGRAGEHVAPPRASVSDRRQPTEREAAAAAGGPATSQGGVWIRIASSGRADEPGPAHGLLCQFGLARLVAAGRRADAASLERRCQGPLGPTSTGPSAAAAPCRERDPKRRPWCVRGLVPLGHLATYRCAAAARRRQVADAPDHRTARSLTTFGGVHAGAGRPPGTAAAAWAGGRRGTYGPDESGRSPVADRADSCHTVPWFTAGRRWRCKVPGDCS